MRCFIVLLLKMCHCRRELPRPEVPPAKAPLAIRLRLLLHLVDAATAKNLPLHLPLCACASPPSLSINHESLPRLAPASHPLKIVPCWLLQSQRAQSLQISDLCLTQTSAPMLASIPILICCPWRLPLLEPALSPASFVIHPAV